MKLTPGSWAAGKGEIVTIGNKEHGLMGENNYQVWAIENKEENEKIAYVVMQISALNKNPRKDISCRHIAETISLVPDMHGALIDCVLALDKMSNNTDIPLHPAAIKGREVLCSVDGLFAMLHSRPRGKEQIQEDFDLYTGDRKR